MHESVLPLVSSTAVSGGLLADASAANWTAASVHFVHVLAAIVAAGAAFFQWWAVHPALARYDMDLRRRVRESIADRWRLIVFACIVLLIATGLTTYVAFRIPALKTDPNRGLYHALFGVKFLAALGSFHCAAVLALPGVKGQAYRDRARFWLPFMVVLLVIVILLASVLRAISPATRG